jgi:serine O-acetyltransferase
MTTTTFVSGVKKLFGDLRKDAERYTGLGGWYQNPGFWIGATHRFGEWTQTVPSASIRIPLRSQYRLANRFWRTMLNVHIAGGTKIGPGLCLIHPRNIMVAPTEIGENCLIFHEVTLGTNANGSGVPKIGNNVDIYVGARLLGGLVVEDNAKIGANCVVTNNVRAGSVVVPAGNRTVSPKLVQAFGPRRGDPPREPAAANDTDSATPLRALPRRVASA